MNIHIYIHIYIYSCEDMTSLVVVMIERSVGLSSGRGFAQCGLAKPAKSGNT